MFTKASTLAILASVAAAQLHPPTGDAPKGNAITRPMKETVHACEPFTITWTPTTPNTVSVLLLKGPSTNVVKHGPSIAEGIPNNGSIKWTPASSLEATEGPNGYGIQIIDDATGQYQYSTQFGISTEGCKPEGDKAAGDHKPVPDRPAVTAEPPLSVPAATSTAPPYPVSSAVNISSSVPFPNASATVHASSTPCSGIIPSATVNASATLPSMPYPSGSNQTNITVPNATAPVHLPESTGAASVLQAGINFAGAVAALALLL